MPARGDHSLRPSARVRGLNFCGRALKVSSTQSAIASGSGRLSNDMAISRPSVASSSTCILFVGSYGDLGVDFMLRVEKLGPCRRDIRLRKRSSRKFNNDYHGTLSSTEKPAREYLYYDRSKLLRSSSMSPEPLHQHHHQDDNSQHFAAERGAERSTSVVVSLVHCRRKCSPSSKR